MINHGASKIEKGETAPKPDKPAFSEALFAIHHYDKSRDFLAKASKQMTEGNIDTTESIPQPPKEIQPADRKFTSGGVSPKAIIEALLFISEKPLLIDQIKDILENLETAQIRGLLLELKADYEENNKGLRIEEVAGGFQMATSAHVCGALKKFYTQRDAQRLSKPALETLAIIAYKQPVTRLDIESFRGVNVDGVLRSLLEKGLIRITGKKDIIGRPFVYGTTRQFLEYFGLNSLDDLPKIEDFAALPAAPTSIPISLSNAQNQKPPENEVK